MRPSQQVDVDHDSNLGLIWLALARQNTAQLGPFAPPNVTVINAGNNPFSLAGGAGNTLLLVDSTIAGVPTINLPAVPTNLQTVRIVDFKGNSAVNPIRVNAQGAGIKVANFANPGNYVTSANLASQGASVEIIFIASLQEWVETI